MDGGRVRAGRCGRDDAGDAGDVGSRGTEARWRRTRVDAEDFGNLAKKRETVEVGMCTVTVQ